MRKRWKRQTKTDARIAVDFANKNYPRFGSLERAKRQAVWGSTNQFICLARRCLAHEIAGDDTTSRDLLRPQAIILRFPPGSDRDFESGAWERGGLSGFPGTFRF